VNVAQVYHQVHCFGWKNNEDQGMHVAITESSYR